MFTISIFGQGLDSLFRSFSVTDKVAQFNSGIQQYVLPSGILTTYTYQSLRLNTSIVNDLMPLSISGYVNRVNGNLISQNSGIKVSYDPRLMSKVQNKIKLDTSITSLAKAPGQISSSKSLKDSLFRDPALKPDVDSLFYAELDSLKAKETSRLDSVSQGYDFPTKLFPDSLRGSISSGNLALDSLKAINPVNVGRSVLINKSAGIDSLKINNPTIPSFKDSITNGNVVKNIVIKKVQPPVAPKGNSRIEKLKKLDFGLSTLDVSPLICNGNPYQGFSVGVSINKTSSIEISSGITNKFPSFKDLYRQPQLLNGGNFSQSINSVSPAELNLKSNNLYFNRDLLNLNNRSFFAGACYSIEIDSSLIIKAKHFYTQSLDKQSPSFSIGQLSSLSFEKKTQYFTFEAEVANSSISGRANTIASDSSYSNNIPNTNLAPAARISAKATIWKGLAVKVSYKNLSNEFYSPLQLFNNNLKNQFALGYQVNAFQGKLNINSDVSNGFFRVGSKVNRIISTSHSIHILPSSQFQYYGTFTFGQIGDGINHAINHSISAGVVFASKSNSNIRVSAEILSYKFRQDQQSDTIVGDYTQLTNTVYYRYSKKSNIISTACYGYNQHVHYASEKLFFNHELTKQISITEGISYLSVNSSRWISLIGGFKYSVNKRVNASISFEQSIISNDRSITNGIIQANYIF